MRHYPPRNTSPPTHTGWSPHRDRAAQARFRQALIQRSGGRCEWPDCNTPYLRLQAHHDKPGYTEDCGRFLCSRHHRKVDSHAR